MGKTEVRFLKVMKRGRNGKGETTRKKPFFNQDWSVCHAGEEWGVLPGEYQHSGKKQSGESS